MELIQFSHYVAVVIGLVTIFIGSAAALKPASMSKQFGIAASGLALPYVVSTGIRDVFIGLVVLLVFHYENWYLLGYFNLFIAVVAISDFLIVRKYGDKKISLVHLFSAGAVLGYGLFLLIIH